MIIGVVGNHGAWHRKQLEQAAKALNFELCMVRFAELAARLDQFSVDYSASDEDLLKLDGLLLRSMGRATLQQIVFRMDLLHELEVDGIRIINQPKTIEWSIDKYLSLSMLRRSGLPILDTLVVQVDEDVFANSDSIEQKQIQSFFHSHEEVVLKPVFGSEGRGLEKFSSFEEWVSFFEKQRKHAKATSHSISIFGGVYYFQKYIKHHEDIRILVVGDDTFAVRRSNPNHWINNVSLGARCEIYRPSQLELDLANAACSAVGGEVIGVDLMHTPAGPVILEVNAAPGWKGVQSVTESQIALRVLELFRK